jgi:hypothetical protein
MFNKYVIATIKETKFIKEMLNATTIITTTINTIVF